MSNNGIKVSFNIHPRWVQSMGTQQFLAPLKDAGLSALEFALEAGDPDWPKFEPLMEEVAELGYAICFHAPFHQGYNPAGFNGSERESIISQYRPMLEIAQRWGMRQGIPTATVLHSARASGPNRESLVKDTVEFVKWVMGEFDHILLAVENLGPTDNGEFKIGDTREEVLSIVTAAGNPRAGICWDFGHDCLHQRLSLPDEEWLQKVVHVHIHDIDAEGIDHHPLVFGNCPYRDWLRALVHRNMTGAVTLEVKGGQMKGWTLEKVMAALTDSIAEIFEVSR